MSYLTTCTCPCGATDTVILAVADVARFFATWGAYHTAPGCMPAATSVPLLPTRPWVERQLLAIEAALIARGVRV